MKKIFLTPVFFLAAACSTAKFGAGFDPTVHGEVEDGKNVVIIYPNPNIENGLFFSVSLNRKHRGELFPGTFLLIAENPGPLELRISEHVQFGHMPETYSFGAAKNTLNAAAGQAVYVRLRKELREEFVQCEETRKTITICKKQRHITLIEPVEKSTALPELSGLKESL